MERLKKNEVKSFEEIRPGLNKVIIGLGWQIARLPWTKRKIVKSGILCWNSDNVCEEQIQYEQFQGAKGSILYKCDSANERAEKDIEQIVVNFSLLPKKICKVSVVLYIPEGVVNKKDFTGFHRGFVRIFRMENNKDVELSRFYLPEDDYHSKTGIYLIDFFKNNNGVWQLKPIAQSARIIDLNDMAAFKVKNKI